MQPVFRFAPSPNGPLHLGHARSALLNEAFARRLGGRLLLRIEDIDPARSSEAHVQGIIEDLAWLGLTFEQPVVRQSSRMAAYRAAAERLAGVLYPCSCSRTEIAEAAGDDPPRDPDGAILYPGTCRDHVPGATPHAMRLRMRVVCEIVGPLDWQEGRPGAAPAVLPANPQAWGDAVIQRKDTPTSYHLAVVVDDAFQGITHVVRGADLQAATSLHRLLQHLLDLPAPLYFHHALVLDEDGRKLAKSRQSTSLRSLRQQGATPDDARRLSGFEEELAQ
jgi:glutamyl-Q tRNA(Asp) synthetase